MSESTPGVRETAAAVFDLADQAIGLFLEYRDQHGHDEVSARSHATTDVAEGATVDVPGCPGWQLAPPGSVVVQRPLDTDTLAALLWWAWTRYQPNPPAWRVVTAIEPDTAARFRSLAEVARTAYEPEATPAPESGDAG